MIIVKKWKSIFFHKKSKIPIKFVEKIINFHKFKINMKKNEKIWNKMIENATFVC